MAMTLRLRQRMGGQPAKKQRVGPAPGEGEAEEGVADDDQ